MTATTSTGRSAAGRALVTVGALPFAAGVASNAAGLGKAGAPRLVCPFAEATGLPCPFCGASRAFRHAVVGDPAFLSFNPFWVLVAVAMIVAGVVLILRSRRPRRAATAPAAPLDLRMALGVPVGLVVLLFLGGWCVALINRDAIIG